MKSINVTLHVSLHHSGSYRASARLNKYHPVDDEEINSALYEVKEDALASLVPALIQEMKEAER